MHVRLFVDSLIINSQVVIVTSELNRTFKQMVRACFRSYCHRKKKKRIQSPEQCQHVLWFIPSKTLWKFFFIFCVIFIISDQLSGSKMLVTQQPVEWQYITVGYRKLFHIAISWCPCGGWDFSWFVCFRISCFKEIPRSTGLHWTEVSDVFWGVLWARRLTCLVSVYVS